MALTTSQVIRATVAIMDLDQKNARDILLKLLETNPKRVFPLLVNKSIISQNIRCATVPADRKIPAIKCWRELTGYGLAESKAFVEGIGTYTTSKYKEFSEAMEKHGAILEVVS